MEILGLLDRGAHQETLAKWVCMGPREHLAGPYRGHQDMWVCQVLRDVKEKRVTQVRGLKMDPHPGSLGNLDALDPKD